MADVEKNPQQGENIDTHRSERLLKIIKDQLQSCLAVLIL